MSNLLHGGELHRFPTYQIMRGLKYGETLEQYKNLRLYKDQNDWWWIYYSRIRMTGRFESKKMAMQWFQQKGR